MRSTCATSCPRWGTSRRGCSGARAGPLSDDGWHRGQPEPGTHCWQPSHGLCPEDLFGFVLCCVVSVCFWFRALPQPRSIPPDPSRLSRAGWAPEGPGSPWLECPCAGLLACPRFPAQCRVLHSLSLAGELPVAQGCPEPLPPLLGPGPSPLRAAIRGQGRAEHPGAAAGALNSSICSCSTCQNQNPVICFLFRLATGRFFTIIVPS